MSRGSLGEGVMVFGGDDRDFQKVADGVERRMRQVAQAFQLSSFNFSHPGFDAIAKGLDDVEKSAARASQGLFNLGRTYYFTRAADGLRSMASEASKFAVEIAKGNATVGGLIEAMAKKIPFGIGALVEAGRDIRDLITGDSVHVAQTEADTKKQEEKIDLQRRLALAIQKVGDAGQKAGRDLNFTVGDSRFFHDAQAILQAGESAAAKRKLEKSDTEGLLKAANDRKLALAKELDELKALPGTSAFATEGVNADEPDPREKAIQEKAKEIQKLEDQVAELRKKLDELNKVMTEIGGRPTFTAIFNLVGAEAEKGLGRAEAAINRFIGRIPEMTKATQKMVDGFNAAQQGRAGNIGQFLGEQNSLGGDFARGLLSPDLFRRLTDKSFADQMVRTSQSIYQQYAPMLTTMARFFDSGFGLSAVFGKYFGALGQVPGLLPGAVAQPKPFQSSFVGLSELGNRIQSAAASSPDQNLAKIADNTTTANKIAQQMFDAIKDIGGYATVK